MIFFRPSVAFATALLCACGPVGRELSTDTTVAVPTVGQTQVARGLSFVETECSGCHAVRPGVVPPNSQAPSFVVVANGMGFNQDTLRAFFRDGHDSPALMSIKLGEEEAEMAAAYIMSLRSPR